MSEVPRPSETTALPQLGRYQLLEKLGAMSGKMQKSVLRLAYLAAIAGALLPFLNWGRGRG